MQVAEGRETMNMQISKDNKFKGRTDEVARLMQMLEPTGARVLIHGMSGVGKDSLATHVLHEL